MRELPRAMLLAATVLGGFAVVGTGMVAATHQLTAATIAANEHAALLEQLHALIPASDYDNRLTEDTLQIQDPALLGTPEPVTVYRAFQGKIPVAILATPVAPNGYSGPIQLLVAVRADGSVAGVRVLAHRETPGLGDKIEASRSDWISNFAGHSLDDPAIAGWTVQRDGGAFDQFAGATITPRAVVHGVRDFLRFFHTHRETLITPPPEAS